MNLFHHRHQVSRKLLAVVSVLTAVTIACNLPFISIPVPLPKEATPAADGGSVSRGPLPPVVVETSPLPSALLPAAAAVSLTFDQPMDRDSVEGAVKVEPAIPGSFAWEGDTTIRFVPDQPLAPETQFKITVADTARSAEGVNLLRTASFTFQTSGALKVVERLPKPGNWIANPSSKVAVTFNQPVAELGDSNAPPAFTLEPAVDGSGSWLNTSTYVFEPNPALGGGIQYRVKINPEITSLGGARPADGTSYDWSFMTSPPAVHEVLPAAGTTIMLDEEFQLSFNQPMDTVSVEQNFSLQDAAGNIVNGTFIWSDRDTKVTFQPDELLHRGNVYSLQLARQARSRGGTELQCSTRMDYQSVGEFSFTGTVPAQGEHFYLYGNSGSVDLHFNAPPAGGQDFSRLIQIEPAPGELSIQIGFTRNSIQISGSFIKGAVYHVSIEPGLRDKWGSELRDSIAVKFIAFDSEPSLSLPSYTGHIFFARPGDSTLPAYVTNLNSLHVSKTQLTFQELLDFVYSCNKIEEVCFPYTEKWTQPLTLPRNVTQGIDIDLTPDESTLQEGLYYYSIDSPELPYSYLGFKFAMVTSNVQVTIKQGQTEVFLWVTNLATGQPVAGAPVKIYNSAGNPAAVGTTSADGTAVIPLQTESEHSPSLVVVVGTSGRENYGIGITDWEDGIRPPAMGISSVWYQPELDGYVYTDRPIYRPGETVYFRAVLRTIGDARYTMPDLESATFQLFGTYADYWWEDPLLDTVQLEVSSYGTVAGEFTLPEDAIPGFYQIQMEGYDPFAWFEVSQTSRPEVNVQVNFDRSDYRAGVDIRAQIEADYYRGGPISDVMVKWTLYSFDEYFDIPGGYVTGLADTSWLKPYWYEGPDFWYEHDVASGVGQTDADGKLSLTFAADELAEWMDLSKPGSLMLSVFIDHESGAYFEGRGSTLIHPDNDYIGIKPDSWIGVAGDAMGFTIQTADWEAEPAANKDLTAVFQRVEWVQDWSNPQNGLATYKEQLTEISTVNFRTDADGKARIEFDVDQAGSYRLDVRGGRAVSQVLLWIGGAGSVVFPTPPEQQLRLQSDRDTYEPGDTAKIFITNPFPQGARALVTVERLNVRHYQLLDIYGASKTVSLNIEDDDAPNTFVSVLLLGKTGSGKPDFRFGIIKLTVDPKALLLDVDLTFEKTTFAPGETARAAVQVRDSAGNPVQGEFSMAVVDKSIFTLDNPTADEIVKEFYGSQPLHVWTSTSLAAYIQRELIEWPYGRNNGGFTPPEPVNDLREKFKDTAYWTGSFETDETGLAVVEFPLPDNPTTWVVTVRGLTRDTMVGEATAELQVARGLIVRPVTPRFLVTGDRVQLGAVVNNNTAKDLDVSVKLDAVGVALSDSNPVQSVQVPAGGQRRVNWWAVVQDAGAARLVFSASSGSLQDSSTPVMGDIPILHYSSPQTFGTSGLMTAAGENLEVVSLPESFEPTGGELKVEMNSSLTGTVLDGLEVMETYPTGFVEPVVSHLLANLAGYNLLMESGSSQPDLLAQYQRAILKDLDILPILQHSNEGFSWSTAKPSDLYLTSYALLALTWADEAGFNIQPNLVEVTRDFVLETIEVPGSRSPDWQLDRLALAYYALGQAGASGYQPENLYEFKERLSPWAKALLALSLISHDTQMTDTLLADLEGMAVRSSTGVNWQGEIGVDQNFATPTFNTAVVIYALSIRDPDSPMLEDAVRYLINQRQASGGWYSSYDTAWILTALTRHIRRTGELQVGLDYSAVLNGAPLASGSAASTDPWTVVRVSVPLNELDQEAGNELRFIRGEGAGRLYYRAFLDVGQRVEDAPPVDRGLSISRDYILGAVDCSRQDCPAVESVSLQAKNPVVIGRVSITVPKDMYYVVVEDAIPAGAEIIDRSQVTEAYLDRSGSWERLYDPIDPFGNGWGWWRFASPTYHGDHIQWVAEYLPAGTYILTYQFQPQIAGEFRVLPARAYSYYLPEVEGRSAGAVFTIKE